MNAVDTNLLIYVYDDRMPAKRDAARRLVEGLRDGILLWQVAGEFINASRKLARAGFTPDIAWRRLAEVMELLKLVIPSPKVLERARDLHLGQQVQFWDAMLLAACQDAGVTTLYSEDAPGSAIPGVRVVNPFTT